jgi:hypothetical protein
MTVEARTEPPVVSFTVRGDGSGCWRVCEQGFEKAIAEFADGPLAEQYAMRLAESKPNWKVDVYAASGELIGTYNSEDDAMPKPGSTDAQS